VPHEGAGCCDGVAGAVTWVNAIVPEGVSDRDGTRGEGRHCLSIVQGKWPSHPDVMMASPVARLLRRQEDALRSYAGGRRAGKVQELSEIQGG